MKSKHIIIAIIILLFLLFIWRLSDSQISSSPAATPSPSPTVESAEEMDLFATPEHMKNPENHALALEIIGPEGDKIFPAQARMYNAYIKGNAKYEMAKINCHWKFYLNEYSDEVLFQQMDNSSILSEAEKEVCGFTHTFINKPGQLRVELTAELTTIAGDPLETVVAERAYLVAK
jgi:hypothetical protein